MTSEGSPTVSLRLAINGFGRIGRALLEGGPAIGAECQGHIGVGPDGGNSVGHGHGQLADVHQAVIVLGVAYPDGVVPPRGPALTGPPASRCPWSPGRGAGDEPGVTFCDVSGGRC